MTQHLSLFKSVSGAVKGAALYAYNDAVFSEDDWKGVRMLLQSVKQNDPHKVGYFGMGFKSVFHITGVCVCVCVCVCVYPALTVLICLAVVTITFCGLLS